MVNWIGGFTLVELLIVIAILAILAAAVVIVLNPSELMAQARDAQRTTDVKAIKESIGLLIVDNPTASLGLANVTYVSLPDTSATCANITGLPIIPTGWSYNCVTSANLRNINGSGWIPINLTSSNIGSPLASLPIDPINSVTDGNYYAYVASGSLYKVSMVAESAKYLVIGKNDGGLNEAVYEVGSGIQLAPFSYGPALKYFSDFKNWTASGGATIDSNGVAHFTAYGQSIRSPYVPVGGSSSWRVNASFYQTTQSPYLSYQPNGGMLWGSDYFGSNFQSVTNTSGYTGNGNAQVVPLNSWQSKSWNGAGGPNVYYLRITIRSDATYTPTSMDIRSPSFSY